MARLASSAVCLRIRGDDLDPEEITQLLGGTPSASHRKGDLRKSGMHHTFGVWHLEAKTREPSDFDAQISEILDRLTDDLTRWAEVSRRFEMDLFCGGFMDRSNEGFSLSVKALRSLADRRIEFGLDLYAPDEEQTGNPPPSDESS